jgi:HD-GYP domain-containing protein (c-di-GMP phosphodiesterase class II)
LTLQGEAIDRALGAMGDFADLASPYLVGHSAGVAELAAAPARLCRLEAADLSRVRRGALVHDLGRVAVPVRIWQQPAPLTPDDWERVRLHAYYSERVLARSPFLGALAPVASFHHERLDGSTPMPSPRCWRWPGTASHASSGQRG